MPTEFTTVDQLPEDPLKMPPPYWRSSGVIFQITSALEDLCKLLRALREVHPRIENILSEYFARNPEPPEDDEEFADISEPLWELESNIKLKCELAVFMAAIKSEDLINQVSVYNLHKDISESIERLSPSEKYLVVTTSLTESTSKSTRPYEAIKSLTAWRNTYAHGHCTDRPTKSLRHNHLIAPNEYPSVPKEVQNMVSLLEGYLVLSRHLRSISRNDYTKSESFHDSEIEEYLSQVKRYKFSYKGNGEIYELKYTS